MLTTGEDETTILRRKKSETQPNLIENIRFGTMKELSAG